MSASLFLTETLLCCFTNHYGPMHQALSAGKTWKGTTKDLCQGQGQSLSTLPVTSSKLSAEDINHIESSEPFLSPWGAKNSPVPMALWASG